MHDSLRYINIFTYLLTYLLSGLPVRIMTDSGTLSYMELLRTSLFLEHSNKLLD